MIFIGLGSNLGDRIENLELSLKKMSQTGIEIKRISPIYQSKAWGFTDQADFYNAVVEVGFSGSPHHLLAILNSIEGDLGRVRTLKWGPRTIDLDIIEFDGTILNSETLVLPHPLYMHRNFVLCPLKDLEPHWVPSGEKMDITAFLNKLDSPLPVKLAHTLSLQS